MMEICAAGSHYFTISRVPFLLDVLFMCYYVYYAFLLIVTSKPLHFTMTADKAVKSSVLLK